MDTFLTFLSNYYVWFLVAAGIFLFALIGLIIESSKKHKKDGNEGDTSGIGTVESFRSGSAPTSVEPTPENIEVSNDVSFETPTESVEEPMLDLTAAPTMEGISLEAPSLGDTPVMETPSMEVPSLDTPVMETPSFEEAPAVEAPVMEAPAFEIVQDAPAMETPVAETPVMEAPTFEAAPTMDAPTFETVAAPEAPAFETPAPETPVMEAPSFEAPAFESVEAPAIDTNVAA